MMLVVGALIEILTALLGIGDSDLFGISLLSALWHRSRTSDYDCLDHHELQTYFIFSFTR